MRTKVNQVMVDILGPDALYPDRVSAPVPEKMRDEIKNGFEEIDGCIVAKGWFSAPIDKAGDDETGTECVLSKIHIDSFVDGHMLLEDVLRIAITFALELKRVLSQSAVAGPFRIIIMGKSGFNTCTVRFHRLRSGQPWLDSDLEHYTDPVMAIDFEPSHGVGPVDPGLATASD